MFRKSRRTVRFSPRRFSRGPIARVATRPKIYNRANFFTVTTHVLNNGNPDFSTVNTAIMLARHSNLMDTASGTGRGYADQVRWIDIGGVVMNYGMNRRSGWESQAQTAFDDQAVWNGVTLLTDRLDAGGAPVTAATTQWCDSQPPVAQVSASQPELTAQNQDFPTKIHFRKWWRDFYMAQEIVTNAEPLVGVHGQRVQLDHPTLNKKLRLRLGAEDGLFFQFSSIQGPGFEPATQVIYDVWVQGQIYYRVRD